MITIQMIFLYLDCEHECTICNYLFQTNEQDKIHMRTMHNIKPNSEITYSKWQQFTKTGRKDGIQKQSDFTTN